MDINTFDEGWPDFLKAAEGMEGMIRESVSRIDRCIFGKNDFQRIYSFQFHDKSSFEQALTSPPGQKAGNIIHEITGGEVLLISGTFQEDSLSHIQSSKEEIEES